MREPKRKQGSSHLCHQWNWPPGGLFTFLITTQMLVETSWEWLRILGYLLSMKNMENSDLLRFLSVTHDVGWVLETPPCMGVALKVHKSQFSEKPNTQFIHITTVLKNLKKSNNCPENSSFRGFEITRSSDYLILSFTKSPIWFPDFWFFFFKPKLVVIKNKKRIPTQSW